MNDTRKSFQVTYALITPDGEQHVYEEQFLADTRHEAILGTDALLRLRTCLHAFGDCECAEDPSKDVWNYWVAVSAGRRMWGWEPESPEDY